MLGDISQSAIRDSKFPSRVSGQGFLPIENRYGRVVELAAHISRSRRRGENKHTIIQFVTRLDGAGLHIVHSKLAVALLEILHGRRVPGVRRVGICSDKEKALAHGRRTFAVRGIRPGANFSAIWPAILIGIGNVRIGARLGGWIGGVVRQIGILHSIGEPVSVGVGVAWISPCHANAYPGAAFIFHTVRQAISISVRICRIGPAIEFRLVIRSVTIEVTISHHVSQFRDGIARIGVDHLLLPKVRQAVAIGVEVTLREKGFHAILSQGQEIRLGEWLVPHGQIVHEAFESIIARVRAQTETPVSLRGMLACHIQGTFLDAIDIHADHFTIECPCHMIPGIAVPFTRRRLHLGITVYGEIHP